MKRYRRRNRKYILYTVCVVIASALLFVTATNLKNEKNTHFVEKIIKDACIFTSEVLYAPIGYVRDKIEVFKEKNDLYRKYKEMEKELDSIEQKNSTIKELELENKKMKEILELNNSLSEYDKIHTTIVNRNSSYWFEKLVVNKGSASGVEQNMAAIASDGLVGYVSATSNFSSDIQLLTIENIKNKISVKVEIEDDKYENGLLIGYDKKTGLYKIEGIGYSGKIKKGSIVTTTGLNDNFPSGILIGYVSNITTDNFELGKILEVEPSVDFNNINYVTILNRKAIINK